MKRGKNRSANHGDPLSRKERSKMATTLNKASLETQIESKSAERMKIIRELEKINAEIVSYNETLKELQARTPVLGQKSMDLKVEVEQLEKLIATME